MDPTILAAIIGGLFAIGAALAPMLFKRRRGSVKSNVQKSSTPQGTQRNEVDFQKDDFLRIKSNGENDGWVDVTQHISEYRANSSPGHDSEFVSQAEFFFYGQYLKWSGDPGFEVVFTNNYNVDLTVTEVGIEFVSAKDHKTYSGGSGEPVIVPVVNDFKVQVPTLYKDGELLAQFPRPIWLSLEDPYFLSPGTAWRYKIKLEEYADNLPSAVLIQFMIRSNAGIAKSPMIYLQN